MGCSVHHLSPYPTFPLTQRQAPHHIFNFLPLSSGGINIASNLVPAADNYFLPFLNSTHRIMYASDVLHHRLWLEQILRPHPPSQLHQRRSKSNDPVHRYLWTLVWHRARVAPELHGGAIGMFHLQKAYANQYVFPKADSNGDELMDVKDDDNEPEEIKEGMRTRAHIKCKFVTADITSLTLPKPPRW